MQMLRSHAEQQLEAVTRQIGDEQERHEKLVQFHQKIHEEQQEQWETNCQQQVADVSEHNLCSACDH